MSDTAPITAREALEAAKIWHESADKALSKSGRDDADYHWRRQEHREQIEEIDAALAALSVQPAREGLRNPAQKASVWNDGRRAGIKWAVSFLHDRAKEMNDPGARAALNVAANDLGAEAKAAAPAPVETGWKLVPIEPTAAMWTAGAEPLKRWRSEPSFASMNDAAALCYRAMLDAAPSTGEG